MTDPLAALSKPGLWVALIGTGFMIVQTVLVQRLVIFLGFPTVALAVVTGAMLAGGACGSLLAQWLARPARWRGLTLIADLVMPALLVVNHGLAPLLLCRLPNPFPEQVALSVPVARPARVVDETVLPFCPACGGPGGPGGFDSVVVGRQRNSSVLGGALAVSLVKVMNFGFCVEMDTLRYAAATLVIGRLLWRSGERPSRAVTTDPAAAVEAGN